MNEVNEPQAPPEAIGWKFPSYLGPLALTVAVTLGIGILLLILSGFFAPKVPREGPAQGKLAGDLPLAEVRKITRTRHESAVGTVRAVHEAAVASKILAKVVEVKVKAGQAVTRDDLLIRLDDSDLQTRVKQADAAVNSARANREFAVTEHERASKLLANKAIAVADFDAARKALHNANAELERLTQAARESRVVLEYASIRSPITAIVIEKRVEVGDTVSPGQPLLSLYDPSRMQLVAQVRESLAQKLTVGQKIPGRLEALDLNCEATVSEIVPQAETMSRTFTVKVTGPCPPGIYSGMFGRIFIPVTEEELILVPAAAVFRVGQLDMVDLISEQHISRRSVQLGRKIDDDYEVLAGLTVGEKVVVRKNAKEAQP